MWRLLWVADTGKHINRPKFNGAAARNETLSRVIDPERSRRSVYLRIPACHTRWWSRGSERRTRASAAGTVPASCILSAWAGVAKWKIKGWEPRCPESAFRTGPAGTWPQSRSPRLGSGSRTSPAGGKPWRAGGDGKRGKEGEVGYGVRRQRPERGNDRLHDPRVRNHGVGIIMCFHLIPAVVA